MTRKIPKGTEAGDSRSSPELRPSAPLNLRPSTPFNPATRPIEPKPKSGWQVNQPRFFVVVFGDPANDGNPVESGVYEAGEKYPRFEVEDGDLLLLYCTGNYPGFAQQIRGIGVAVHASAVLIEYRWIPFAAPIPWSEIRTAFDPEDFRKMQRELKRTDRRAFKISPKSFVAAVADRAFAWDALDSNGM